MAGKGTASLSRDQLAELMPDLVYGELDDARADDVRSAIANDAELAPRLRAVELLRQAWRELPEEEPPAAITAQLMKAAADQAKAFRAARDDERAGWLARIAAWLSAQPALAAAASLVLVAGIAGVLVMRDGGTPAHPTATTGEPPPQRPAAPAPTAAPEPDDVAREGADLATEDEENGLKLEASKEAAGERNAPARSKAAPKKPADEPIGGVTRGRGGGGGSSGAVKSKLPDPKPAPGGKSGVGLGTGKRDEAPPPAPPQEPPPPAPTKDAPAYDDDGEAAGGDAPEAVVDVAEESTDKKRPADPQAEVKRLHGMAAAAAERGDCKAARKYASAIKDRDATYYRDVFARDKRVAKCKLD